MINVSEATKSAYLGDSIHKTLTISFPNKNITFTNSDIISESFTLTESIETELYLTFKGCIASQCSFQVAQNVQDLRGQLVTVTIQAGETDVIPLFKGYVDEQNNETQEDIITEFICYDPLYKIGSKNMQTWVDSRTYPITVKNFRDQLFQNIGITQDTATLVNDSRTISENFKTFCDNPSATDIIKWICEANGVFGQYGRDGKFHYREIKNLTKGTYPSPTTYPSTTTYPSGENADIVIESGANLGLTYEPYEIDLITKVTIYDSGGLDIAYAGSGNNVFGITDNPIAFSLNNMTAAAQAIFAKVGGINYIPVVSMKSVGMPYMECGDTFLSYTKRYIVRTPILSRTLNGIQALFDEYASDSDRSRPEHISTTTTRINKDRKTILEVNADLTRFKDIEADDIAAVNGHFEKLITGDIDTGYLKADRIQANSITVAKLTGLISKTDTGESGTTMNAWQINLTEGTMTIGSINANKITAGSISADRIATHSLGVSKISGSLSATDTGQSGVTMNPWELDFTNGTFSIGSINANKIKAGYISADRIDANSISVSKLKGKIETSDYSGATKWEIDLTNGTFSIGSIDASHIKAGTIEADKIKAGTITASQLNIEASGTDGSGNTWSVDFRQGGSNFNVGNLNCEKLRGTLGDTTGNGWGINFGDGVQGGSVHVGYLSADHIDAAIMRTNDFTADNINSRLSDTDKLVVNRRNYVPITFSYAGHNYYILAADRPY